MHYTQLLNSSRLKKKQPFILDPTAHYVNPEFFLSKVLFLQERMIFFDLPYYPNASWEESTRKQRQDHFYLDLDEGCRTENIVGKYSTQCPLF